MEVHGKGTAHPPYMKTIMETCGHAKVGLTWNSNPDDIKDGSVAEYFKLLWPWISSCHINELYKDAAGVYPYRELFRLFRETWLRSGDHVRGRQDPARPGYGHGCASLLQGAVDGIESPLRQSVMSRPLLDQAYPLRHGGKARRFLVHRPANRGDDAPLPVVMVLHGAGATAAWTLGDTGWADKSDREGFLVVLPEGLRPDLTKTPHFVDNPQVWNDGSPRLDPQRTGRRRRWLSRRCARRFADEFPRRFAPGLSHRLFQRARA